MHPRDDHPRTDYRPSCGQGLSQNANDHRDWLDRRRSDPTRSGAALRSASQAPFGARKPGSDRYNSAIASARSSCCAARSSVPAGIGPSAMCGWRANNGAFGSRIPTSMLEAICRLHRHGLAVLIKPHRRAITVRQVARARATRCRNAARPIPRTSLPSTSFRPIRSPSK